MRDMRLSRLEVHGFKTFAQETDFQFDGGLTAIVGPNGSGKSNVADAIRWVLAEQAYTILRVKRTEDLIFTGSAKRPRMGMAQVSLTLSNPAALVESAEGNGSGNGNGQQPAATRDSFVAELLRANPSEVTIMRRAYRSGENEYFVNKQRVRLRDVQELLQRYGLARNTYMVVGQGLIDTALSLKPEERRALFEEAAGIGLYQSKKANALEKLAETQQNLIRINDIINEIAPRLPSLARQADRARKYDEVAGALDGKLKLWYSFQWAKGQEHLALATEREREARADLNTRRTELHDLAAQLATARKQAQEFRARQLARQRERMQREAERSNLARDLAVMEERLRLTEQRHQDALTELGEQRAARDTQAESIAQARALREERERERARVLEHKAATEQRIKDIEVERQQLHGDDPGQARALAHKLAELGDELYLYEQTLRRLAHLIEEAEHLANVETKRRELDSTAELTRTELADARTNIALVERDVTGARTAEENAQALLAQLTNALAAREQRADDLLHQVEALRLQRDELHGRVEAMAQGTTRLDEEAAPEETGLVESERRQAELEEQETAARLRLSEFEERANEMVLDAERARAEIARLESEIEDDLGPVELDSALPRQLRLRLGEGEGELVTLPHVTEAPESLDKEIRKLKNQMRYIGNVNPTAPQEYEELRARHEFLTAQAADLTTAIERLHQAILELDSIMHDRFSATFKAIQGEFARYFNLLFGGGTARLELTDPENLTTTGIEIVARPPGKRAAHLAMLSGGERSLTAQALLFSILKVSPTSFCVLDEVDAMLDEANVGRFRDALRELAAETQFIVITHNRATIEVADSVYGISMSDDGVSQALSMRLEKEAV
jgi:chromosome segregation protein